MAAKKIMLLLASVGVLFGTFADITVSDVEVFSGYPWSEVVVGYTITGMDTSAEGIRLTAMDKALNRSYTANVLVGAELSEGRHLLRWKASSEGVRFSSSQVVFAVSVVHPGGVQLWRNGPFWSESNVGAAKPEEYGYYFWWGGTVGYKRNTADNGWVSVGNGASYVFNPNNSPTYGKNVSRLKSDGYIDSNGNLVSAYDAATAHRGSPWRMPTSKELSALTNNCTMTWTTRNGVYGYLVTGKGAYSSRSIFLPAAGYGGSSDLSYAGKEGYYWSSTSSDDSYFAGNLFFSFIHLRASEYGRYAGHSVRPVRGPAQ